MPVDWPKTRAKARALVVKHWLIICFFIATLIALTWPEPGRAVASVIILGDIHLIQTINIILVFLISGLSLKTDDIKKAARHWLGGVYGFLSILLITPCLGFALRELPLTPPEFAIGLTIFAAVPTTLGVGEALVRASGGNAALALLLLVGTNMLGIATMPPILKLLLSSVDGLGSVTVDAANLLAKLTVTVLVPACIGKAARDLFAPVRAFVTKWKVQLGMCSNVQLALIIWQTLSGAQDVLVHQRFLDIFIVIVAAGIMHAVYLVFNFLAVIYLLRMPLPEAIAVGIMSSQKSAPVAVTVISYLTSNVTQQGLLAVPCISGQLLQIFMGAGFAPLLAKRAKRWRAEHEATAAAAAAVAGDSAAAAPSANTAADGSGGGSEDGAGKLESGGSSSVEGSGCKAGGQELKLPVTDAAAAAAAARMAAGGAAGVAADVAAEGGSGRAGSSTVEQAPVAAARVVAAAAEAAGGPPASLESVLVVPQGGHPASGSPEGDAPPSTAQQS